ncbi:ABC transporter permease [Sulfurovum sp. NBC37-1]|uniref:ABC transporter permease n=1 Tax=Sulfurovum sp. (strain NBC37-1) TaxID=387093 RepID=UPI00015875F9|nr:ABC transporter permease [Sulfurovum sp. NBC37-1]BAF71850.1 dipeptide ABC transporter, permease [Sulfurovum sp. NBC37-1]
MIRYVISRLFNSFLVMLAVSFIAFFIMYKAGDPLQLLLPPDATAQEVAQMRHTLGLDGSFLTQYKSFMIQLSHGNLGNSFIYGEPALDIVLERLPATLELAILAMGVSILLGVPLGVISSMDPDSLKSKAIMLFSLTGISIPVFWIGMMLVLIFSVVFEILPSSGRGEVYLFSSVFTWDGIKHLIMPVTTLSLFQLALIIRLTQSGMREVLTEDYVKFATAKGLPRKVIVYRHAFKNTLLPLITVIGIQFGQLIAFTIVTETIFAWPGTGKLIIDSIQNLDRPVVIAYLLVVALIFILINFIVDILYTWVDPRVRLS